VRSARAGNADHSAGPDRFDGTEIQAQEGKGRPQSRAEQSRAEQVAGTRGQGGKFAVAKSRSSLRQQNLMMLFARNFPRANL